MPSPAQCGQLQGSSWRQEFEFPGVLAWVPGYSDQIMEFVSAHCPGEGDRIDIFVAIQEALANAALHGCNDDPSNKIRCAVTADASEITIAVRDPGRGFDLERADPDKYQATRLTHGRGICLMRSLMSEVTFAHGGAEVFLRKRINLVK
jgi:anti-sigma regulatory factor (Ser/Thr protein kinase)